MLNSVGTTLLDSATGKHVHADGASSSTEHATRNTQHEIAVNTLNTVLLPAMKEVGDKFGAGSRSNPAMRIARR